MRQKDGRVIKKWCQDLFFIERQRALMLGETNLALVFDGSYLESLLPGGGRRRGSLAT